MGENGPVIVTLFKSDTPSNQTNGVLVKGTITAADLEGPIQGKQISDLVSAMSSGETYVNVHTCITCIRVWPSLVCLADDQFLVKSLRQEDSGIAHFRLRTERDVPYSALIMLIPNLGSPST